MYFLNSALKQVGKGTSRLALFPAISMKASIAIAALFPLLTACVGTITADEQYRRDDALIVAAEQYKQKQRSCAAKGGAMLMRDARRTRIKRAYTLNEYRAAECVRL